jgi:hypothetical protein
MTPNAYTEGEVTMAMTAIGKTAVFWAHSVAFIVFLDEGAAREMELVHFLQLLQVHDGRR